MTWSLGGKESGIKSGGTIVHVIGILSSTVCKRLRFRSQVCVEAK